MARKAEQALQRISLMAMSREKRRGERGLSLIEALVIVSVTALLSLLLLPLVSTAANRNFQRAEHALDVLETAGAEAQFRTLLGSVVQDGQNLLRGNEAGVTFLTSADAPVLCAPAGPPTPVRLRIVPSAEGGRLLCDAQGRSVEVLHWSEGVARLSYSADGANWSAAWESRERNSQTARGGSAAASYAAPYVRFGLFAREAPVLEWTEQAGWTEPTRLEAEATR